MRIGISFRTDKPQLLIHSTQEAKNMKRLICITFAFTVICATASAALIVDFVEVGSDVEVTLSGTLNLTDLSVVGSGSSTANWINIAPQNSYIGSAFGDYISWGNVIFNGTLGTGDEIFESVPRAGDLIVIDGYNGNLQVYDGYSSGDPINSTLTFSNTNIAALGIDPDFSVTWASGQNADSITIGAVGAIPEPAGMMLLMLGAGFSMFINRGCRNGMRR